jgi:ABC-type transport system involved in multi-copper enzyme maturation permease subunit
VKKLSLIIRKELSDAVSNRTFQLATGILIVYMIIVGVSSGEAYYEQQRAVVFNRVGELLLIGNLASPINSLGAFIAIAFSFATINKERVEGSLKVMLSYPIYRDEIILGKIIAGFTLICLAIVVSMGMSLSFYLLITNISPTLDLMLRFTAVMFLGLLLLLSYLGIGVLLSMIFRDPKVTLIVMFLFVGLFNSEAFISLSQAFSKILYGPSVLEQAHMRLNVGVDWLPQGLPSILLGLNPSWSFRDITGELGNSVKIIISNGAPAIIPTDFSSIISEHNVSIAMLVIIPLIAFALNYMVFTRRDIS